VSSRIIDAASDHGPRSLRLLADAVSGWQLVTNFHWHRDRFLHQLWLLPTADTAPADAPPQGRPAVEAVEDIAPLAWPLNPPLQQLDHCQLSGHRQGLVGLGMAGTSHWSLAVEVEGSRLWFDVACRVQQAPGPLRSSYRWADAGERPAGQSWRLRQPRAAVLFFPRDDHAGSPLVGLELTADERSTELCVDECAGLLQLRPKQPPATWPATICWRYRWSVTA
jgi:hypothetical protein